MATPKSIAEVLADARLPRLEQRLLLQSASGLDHAAMVRGPEATLEAGVYQRYLELLSRRLAGEPIAHILGSREFFGRLFKVDKRVLIPRPETELLIELALTDQRLAPGKRVLDIGTGSGCIAITIALESPDARVEAIDVSDEALKLAKENAIALGATVTFTQADISRWREHSALHQSFDLILANLPYIAKGDFHLLQGDLRFEPMLALTDGLDGLSLIDAAIDFSRNQISPGGWLLLEHGYNQGAAVRDRLTRGGFQCVATHPDLAGLERVSLGLHPG